jgi:hypothetical protein
VHWQELKVFQTVTVVSSRARGAQLRRKVRRPGLHDNCNIAVCRAPRSLALGSLVGEIWQSRGRGACCGSGSVHVSSLGGSWRRALFLHPSYHTIQTSIPRVHTSRAYPPPCTMIGYFELILQNPPFSACQTPKSKSSIRKRADTSHAMQVSSLFGTRGKAFATAPFCGLQIGAPCCAL